MAGINYARYEGIEKSELAGAIVMAAEAGARSARPEVRALAEAIVADQAREIGQMQAWRR